MSLRIVGALWTALLLCGAYAWLPELAFPAALAMLATLRTATARQAFYVALITGIGFSCVLAGMMHAGFNIYVAAALAYALGDLFFAVPLVLVGRRLSGFAWALCAASLWVLSEWLHAQLPSAADILGNTQTRGPFLALARLSGSYLISFQIVLLAAAALESWRMRRWRYAVYACCVWALLAAWAYAERPLPTGERTIAAIQGGLPMWLYRAAQDGDGWRGVPERVYAELTKRTAADVVVWPETAIWRWWGDDPEYEAWLTDVQRSANRTLLVGTLRRARQATNSALVLHPHGPPAWVDKQRLALQVESGLAAGEGGSIVHAAATRMGVVFCLETVVPQYVRATVRDGAELVVVLVEGSRFGNTPVSWVHANHSVVRAVEVGRSLVHSGQHAYTSMITADGDRSAPLQPYVASVAQAAVPLYEGLTPYVRVGPWIVWVAAALVVLLPVMARSDRLHDFRDSVLPS